MHTNDDDSTRGCSILQDSQHGIYDTIYLLFPMKSTTMLHNATNHNDDDDDAPTPRQPPLLLRDVGGLDDGAATGANVTIAGPPRHESLSNKTQSPATTMALQLAPLRTTKFDVPETLE